VLGAILILGAALPRGAGGVIRISVRWRCESF